YDNTPNYSDYPPQPEYQTYICESCGKGAHFATPPVASMEMLHAQTDLIEAMQDFLKKYDHIPHNEKSIKLLLAEEKFLKIKQVVEEEQTRPEHVQELLQSLLKDLQILNDIQPLKQETSNQIQKDQEEKSIVELLAEERLQKANQALNESQSPQEREIKNLERKGEDKIYELKINFNGLSIKIIIDDDDDDLGFYAVHPNTIHTPVSQNVEPKDSLIMGDEHINTTPETETISVETLVSNPSESEGLSDNESECDMPVCDVSSPIFTVFSNPLFDSNDNFSSDDESVSEEEIQKDEFNSFSNPLYDIDDEIITNESNLLSKKDLDEIILIPPGIDERALTPNGSFRIFLNA
ncbi:hypothetical protein Tco_0929282, partial [Tanacetum coccineum]